MQLLVNVFNWKDRDYLNSLLNEGWVVKFQSYPFVPYSTAIHNFQSIDYILEK
jgi:hypothetical protein